MPERAYFSAVEYDYLRDRWGSKKARVGGDSMRNFDQCCLCLASAVSPMACREGHLFCKECILTNLLKQKSDIKEHQAALDRLAIEQENERQRARERAREKVLRDFERGAGFGGSSSTPSSSSSSSGKRKEPDTADDPDVLSTVASIPERARRVAQEAEDAALAAIEEEQRLSRRKKLPAFWLPSLTPNQKEGEVDLKSLGTALEPRCRVVSEHGHPISIKSLTAVMFSRAPSTDSTSASNASEASASAAAGSASRPIICPSCKKALSNSHRLYTVRKCSHTFCSHCTEQLILKPAKESAKQSSSVGNDSGKKAPALACCPECSDGIIKSIDKDVIQLHREGTGYAEAGGAEGKKKGMSFQG